MAMPLVPACSRARSTSTSGRGTQRVGQGECRTARFGIPAASGGTAPGCESGSAVPMVIDGRRPTKGEHGLYPGEPSLTLCLSFLQTLQMLIDFPQSRFSLGGSLAENFRVGRSRAV